jgi:hypothetical protein
MRVTSLALALPAVLSVVAGLALSVPARPAEAKPEYAKKEGKDCAFCHVNPKGGGPRNAKGDEYVKNGRKFPPAPGGFGEDKAFSNENNGKAFEFVRKALEIQHYADAARRLGELKPKEKKGSPGAQLLANTEGALDGKGRDLVKAAKEAIQGGKTQEAADAMIRVETEFKGRDPSKEVSALRASLLKLPGGKEAEVAAKATAPQRLSYLDALMKDAEGNRIGALRVMNDLVAKFPDGPFATDAKTKVAEWTPAAGGAMPAMGG